MTSASSRKPIYALLITVAVAIVAGRIASAELVFEPSLPERWTAKPPKGMPTFGSNDRSRWATIRQLVHEGTFVIGHRTIDPENGTYTDDGITFQDGYFSVDKVLNPETHDFYSSKPPLLTTVLAGEYWVLHQLGLSLDDNRWLVMRFMVFTVNCLPLIVSLFLLSRLVEGFGTTDWGRYFVLAAGCFATLLSTFSITLNNHMPATFCAIFALYPALRIWTASEDPRTRRHEDQKTATRRAVLFIAAGFFGGFAACCELPALALTAGLFVMLVMRAPGRTLAFFVPAAVIPMAAYLLVNYIEIGNVVPVQGQFGSKWYTYEGSNWKPGPDKTGIDYAHKKETRAEYAFHVLLGHHGLFSLSPIYLLAAAGMAWGTARALRKKDRTPIQGETETAQEIANENGEAWLAAQGRPMPGALSILTLYLSVVVTGFYLLKTDNYGGWTSGLRWLMWLTPFWLLTMLPIADRLALSRRGRGLGYFLLAVSVFSVNYRSWNPWRHPWLYDLMQALGWPGY
jgi:hypothetical protein